MRGWACVLCYLDVIFTGQHNHRGTMSDTTNGKFIANLELGVTKTKVVMEFSESVAWFELLPADARRLAADLIEHAEHLDQEYDDDAS